MKKKIVSIVQIVLMMACGVLIIYVVTGQIRKPADADYVSLSGESTATDQQMAASEKTDDQETPKVTKQPEAPAAPKESEKEQPTAEPEATAAPTEATKQPEATAAPTATPKTTKQPEATAAPTATPKATKQPGASATPTPAATKQPTGTPAPAATDPPAQVHTCTWDGGSVTQAASCSSEGVKTYTCTSCGKTKTESIAKTDHSYVTETTPATCTEYGQDRTYCSVCGYEKSKAANSDAPKGHQATDYRVSFGSMGSTCTHPGTYDIYCSVCGACVQREVPREPLGHDLQNPVVIQTASCTAVEITQYTCGTCGELVEEVTHDMDYQNHDWVEGTKVVDDWDNGGVKRESYYYCSRCYELRDN